MRRLLLAAFCGVLLGPVVATADEGALSLERLFDGKPITTPIPQWRWRPGHRDLVRIDTQKPKDAKGGPGKESAKPKSKPKRKTKPRRLLLAKDPATGAQRVLLDFGALDAFIPDGVKGKGGGGKMRGIGRAGPPAYRFTKDGNALCAVVKGDLVWVDLERGTPWLRLTQTRSPMSDLRIAPDGRHVSFARDHDLWVVPTSGGRPHALTTGGSEVLRNSSLDWVYPEEFGFSTGAWWSPDSARIAYLQLDERDVPRHRLPNLRGTRGEGRTMRYPRAGDPNPVARIGVVPVAGGGTTWLELGSPEYVARVAWTPDASRIFVVTLDRKQQHLRLLSCDPETGASVLLLEEKDAHWIDAPPAPRFLDADDHVFTWRSDDGGATRWWLCRTDREHVTVLAQKPLTPPDMDAGQVLLVDPVERVAYYTGTQHGSTVTGVHSGWGGSEDRLWSMPAPFVEDAETWTTASLDEHGEYALVTWSGPATPPRTELRRVEDGERVMVVGDAMSSATKAIEPAVPEELAIEAEGGGRILMRLWKPANLGALLAEDPDRTFPMIVSVYGGPGSRTVRRTWGRGPYFPTLLTRKGYFVLQIDGRGTGAQGAAFKRTVYGRAGVLELEDQVRGALHVAQRSYVDAERIGMWGWSYGGFMTCSALTKRSDVFKVGVAVAPVTDWRLYDTIYTERYMGLPSENKRGYDETAPVRFAKGMNGKLLVLHGLGDDNVHAQNAFRLAEALLVSKKTTSFAMMAYPWRGHGIQGLGLDVFTRLVEWFDRHL